MLIRVLQEVNGNLKQSNHVKLREKSFTEKLLRDSNKESSFGFVRKKLEIDKKLYQPKRATGT